MSLTLFTGGPGAGKTAAAVELVMELCAGTEETGPRPLYVIEVPDPNCPPMDLQLPHTLLGVADGRRWHEIVPDGAVVFMPEVQRLWKPRHSSREPGPDLMALETHRHRGLDLVLDTQHPRMVDAHVKSVCGRHVHLRDTGWLGRQWYEWPEISDTIAWKTCVQKRGWKLPKKVFGLYKSASLHVKPVKGVPPMLYVAIALLVSLAVLIVMGYRTIASKSEQPEAKPDLEAPAPAARRVSSVVGGVAIITAGSIIEAETPRLSHRPETAPTYDHLRVVTVMQRVIGGFCRGERCRCFNQQGLNPGISEQACRAWVANPPFDAYRVEPRREASENGQPEKITPSENRS